LPARSRSHSRRPPILFSPTENRAPSLTATSGAPHDAKMSTPWCQPTVARVSPHVSVKDDCAATGKT
jgi:hypothetical protein